MKFVGIDLSKSLDSYVQKHARSLLKRMDGKGGRYALKLSMKSVARKNDTKVKSFEVTGSIAVAGLTEMRAQKKASSPKKAVSSVLSALEKQLRRHTEKRERSRATMGKTLKPVNEFKWQISRQA